MSTSTISSRNATIVAFPAKVQRQAKRRMMRVEVVEHHTWMMRNCGKWGTVATDGVDEARARVTLLKKMVRQESGLPEPTTGSMRRRIAEGRKLIEKRNRVKAWLVSMGADLESITDAEQALFFAFDKASAPAGAQS